MYHIPLDNDHTMKIIQLLSTFILLFYGVPVYGQFVASPDMFHPGSVLDIRSGKHLTQHEMDSLVNKGFDYDCFAIHKRSASSGYKLLYFGAGISLSGGVYMGIRENDSFSSTRDKIIGCSLIVTGMCVASYGILLLNKALESIDQLLSPFSSQVDMAVSDYGIGISIQL